MCLCEQFEKKHVLLQYRIRVTTNYSDRTFRVKRRKQIDHQNTTLSKDGLSIYFLFIFQHNGMHKFEITTEY